MGHFGSLDTGWAVTKRRSQPNRSRGWAADDLGSLAARLVAAATVNNRLTR
ncbi:hypothetical protein XACM_2611 [Xanthomonas euvesicatoria pv. citrumelo F1]|nr:hypothetical protein XCR_2826 [Xanthomonas campestris pv. raphani 756C]AEO42868.1 hypothetical protein XACM_2611 [Xanthomonas euvesicatoria pv. citrumelo F1]CCF69947.1 hypothetical protein XAPC_3675 [Xanthomonas citri pv. punicae str. LMG 859]